MGNIFNLLLVCGKEKVDMGEVKKSRLIDKLLKCAIFDCMKRIKRKTAKDLFLRGQRTFSEMVPFMNSMYSLLFKVARQNHNVKEETMP